MGLGKKRVRLRGESVFEILCTSRTSLVPVRIKTSADLLLYFWAYPDLVGGILMPMSSDNLNYTRSFVTRDLISANPSLEGIQTLHWPGDWLLGA